MNCSHNLLDNCLHELSNCTYNLTVLYYTDEKSKNKPLTIKKSKNVGRKVKNMIFVSVALQKSARVSVSQAWVSG